MATHKKNTLAESLFTIACYEAIPILEEKLSISYESALKRVERTVAVIRQYPPSKRKPIILRIGLGEKTINSGGGQGERSTKKTVNINGRNIIVFLSLMESEQEIKDFLNTFPSEAEIFSEYIQKRKKALTSDPINKKISAISQTLDNEKDELKKLLDGYDKSVSRYGNIMIAYIVFLLLIFAMGILTENIESDVVRIVSWLLFFSSTIGGTIYVYREKIVAFIKRKKAQGEKND